MTHGAVAGGAPETVRAGIDVLRAGGNATDAAIAASLMACVAEPLLTGLGGAGLAMVRMNREVEVLDLFAAAPGVGRELVERAPMDIVEVDFGPTTQTFHVGPSSVAVPAVPRGLAALHAKYGTMSLADLAQPAASAAAEGIRVSSAFARVLELLWPIVSKDTRAENPFQRGGVPLQEGDTFRWPALGATIREFGSEGADCFYEGSIARAIQQTLGGAAQLTNEDLSAYHPEFRAALSYAYRDATVWVPGVPSVAGVLVLQALRALEDHGPMPPPYGASQLRFLEHAMRRVDQTRRDGLRHNIFRDGFLDGFLSAIAPHEIGEEHVLTGRRPASTGHTTHISVVDEHGNAVGITTSLGETCGTPVAEHGLLLNNFLGESDVNPEDVHFTPGERLMTMCCPAIVELGDRLFVMGSGGSSRIRSAVLHGVVYLTDHGMTPAEAVAAPRAHVEDGRLLIEALGRPRGTVAATRAYAPGAKTFDAPDMFFGGLHVAAVGPEGFEGAGDARRGGTFDVC